MYIFVHSNINQFINYRYTFSSYVIYSSTFPFILLFIHLCVCRSLLFLLVENDRIQVRFASVVILISCICWSQLRYQRSAADWTPANFTWMSCTETLQVGHLTHGPHDFSVKWIIIVFQCVFNIFRSNGSPEVRRETSGGAEDTTYRWETPGLQKTDRLQLISLGNL